MIGSVGTIKSALLAVAWLIAVDTSPPLDLRMADNSSPTPSQAVRAQTLPDCSPQQVAASRRPIAASELARLLDRKALVHVRGRLVPVADCLLTGGGRACATSDWMVRPRAECPAWELFIREVGIPARLERGRWDQEAVDVIVAGRLAVESQRLVLQQAEICRLPGGPVAREPGRLSDVETDRIASRPATARHGKPCPRWESKAPSGLNR
jgi:hypothetical protein